MSRSKNQIASAYAPESFFTFEGGLGACIAKAVPGRVIDLPAITANQIFERIDELARSWFAQAVNCRSSDPGAPAVVPRQTVDAGFLNGDRNDFQSLNTGEVVLMHPDRMGYVPAPVTFVCEACGLSKTYESVSALQVDVPRLSNRNECAHPLKHKRCEWRQLDVVFVHWSGGWERPMPHQWQWDATNNKVVLRYAECSCGSKDFELVRKSKSIGDWFFKCARPGCGKPLSQKWLQNDPESMQLLGAQMSNPARLTEVRMQVSPYRASNVYYVQGDVFIDFKEGANASLSFLRPGRQDQLANFIAQQYGLGAVMPSDDEIEEAVRRSPDPKVQRDWEEYKSYDKTIAAMEVGLKSLPPDQRAQLQNHIDVTLRQAKKRILDSFLSSRVITPTVSLPDRLLQNLGSRQELFAARYDPFRLAVEHRALEETKLNPALRSGGKRNFVRFDELDEDLSPANLERQRELEAQTKETLTALGIDVMGLIREFDLCRFTFGFSRMESGPVLRAKRGMNMPVRLNLFPRVMHDRRRKHPIYVVTQANEAIYVRLSEAAVLAWLKGLNCCDADLLDMNGRIGAALLAGGHQMNRYLERLPKGAEPHIYSYAYTLLHSYAHLTMKTISEYSGLDLGSLSEYLFPTDLAFVVYRSGTTMDLGNLSAMWRNSNVSLLRSMLRPKALLCGSGSLCSTRGSACPDCVMVPETSCIAGNKLLSRAVLRTTGGRPSFDTRQEFVVEGYLQSVEKLAAAKRT
jgi:hypothetical protein